MEETREHNGFEQQIKVQPFYRKLVGGMLLFSLVVLVATALGTTHFYKNRTILHAQQDSVELANFLIAEFSSLFLAPGGPGEKILVVDRDDIPAIDQRLRRTLPALDIVKIKIFDASRKIIFSSEKDLIGQMDRNNPRLARTLAGQVDAHLEHKTGLRDLAGEKKLEVDVVETYVPIRYNNQVLGALEIYRDVNRYTAQIFVTSAGATVVLGLILLLANGAFFLFIRRAGRELKAAQVKLHRMATTDCLTDVPNRGAVLQRAHSELSRFKRHLVAQSPAELGFLMLDIDYFKRINDRYGHLAGDQVLQEICQRIRQQLRDYDALGRFGGEEFLVVLPETKLAAAKNIAERIRAAVAAEPCRAGEQEIPVTISIGVAGVENDEESLDNVLQRADDCLYQAKEAGRNLVVDSCTSLPEPRTVSDAPQDRAGTSHTGSTAGDWPYPPA